MALSLTVIGPLFSPGHILTVDAPLALNQDIAGYFWGTSNGQEGVFAATYNSAPIAAVHNIFAVIIPAWLVEKLWLALIFWLAGVGASRLPFIHGPGRYYAGIFYAVNPFTYVRFVTGQWGILGAYALAPFALTCFIRTLDEPRLANAFKLVLVLTLIGFLQIHGLALTLFILAITYLFRVRLSFGEFKRTLPIILMSASIFLGINMFWIFRYISSASVLKNISIEEMNYFAASPPLDVLSLRGFWLRGPYLDISDFIPVWWLIVAPVIFLAVYGGFKMFNSMETRRLAYSLIAVTTLGLILSAGPGVSFLEPVFRVLWEWVPGYPAFRDSHKFVSLTALGYAYLGGFGVQSLFESMKPSIRRWIWLKRLALACVLAAPIIYSLPIFGAWGQLKPAHYPDEWSHVRSVLDSDQSDFNVLTLPWNMYMDFRWLENRWQRLANPAPNFFSQQTISGDNLEIAVTQSNSSNPISLYMEELLDRRDTIANFGNHIAPLNAKYVVLFEAGDSAEYGFLADQTDLELVYQGETISLYRNLSRTTAVYSTSQITRVDSLQNYFDDYSGENHLGQIYLLGSGENPDVIPTASQDSNGEVEVNKLSPITYRVSGEPESYLTFVLPQTTAKNGWSYGGENSLLNLGMMPVFRANSTANTIVYPRFYTLHLPLYALSLVTLIACGIAYVISRPRHGPIIPSNRL